MPFFPASKILNSEQSFAAFNPRCCNASNRIIVYIGSYLTFLLKKRRASVWNSDTPYTGRLSVKP